MKKLLCSLPLFFGVLSAHAVVNLVFSNPVQPTNGTAPGGLGEWNTSTVLDFTNVAPGSGDDVDMRMTITGVTTPRYRYDGSLPNYSSLPGQPEGDAGVVYTYVGGTNYGPGGLMCTLQFFQGGGTFTTPVVLPEFRLLLYDIDGESVQSESIRVFTADGFTSYQLPGVGGTTHVAEAGGATHLFTGPGGNVPEDDVTGAFILNYANTGLIRLQMVANTSSGNNNNGIFTGIDGDLSLIGGNTGAFDDPVDVLGSISGDVVGEDSQALPGATVVLKDAAGNDLDRDPNTPGVQPYTGVTDFSGLFLFPGLPPGEYQVWLVLPAGYQAVSDSDGGNPIQIGDVETVLVDPGVVTDAGGFVTELIPTTPPPETCFVVADGGAVGGTLDESAEDLLSRVNRLSGIETNLGFTGSFDVEAAEYSPRGNVLFGADGGRLVKLDWAVSAAATPVGSGFGTADGTLGAITLSDVDGLALDMTQVPPVLYGVHRRIPVTGSAIPPPGSGAAAQSVSGVNDILFQINTNTGAVVENAFGPGVDYVVIGALQVGLDVLDDVADIAVDPVSGDMVALEYASDLTARLVAVDKRTGVITEIGDPGVADLEGLSFAIDGSLHGTTGASGAPANTLYDIDPLTGAASNPRRLGNEDLEALACFTANVSVLAGKTWYDEFPDGFRDVEETIATNIEVRLVNSFDQSIVRTAFTDENGDYFFVVPEGSYVVEFIPPDDLLHTFQFATPNTARDSDANPFTGRTNTILTGPNGAAVNVDAGFMFDEAYIYGRVTVDIDNDGLGDDGLDGVELALCFADGFPVLVEGSPMTTFTTDGGYYNFGPVPSGEYRVKQTQPAGYTSVFDADGGDLDEIGDVFLIEISPGFDAYDRDFVEVEVDPFIPGSICGTVYTLGGGSEPDQFALPGVLLALLNGAGNPVYRDGEPLLALSDADGGYCFTNLFPGTYQVVQPSQPQDYESLGDADGGDPNAIGNEQPIEIGGETREVGGADFLEREYANVAGRVFHDLDRDGIEDPGEPGVGSVTVALIDTNGFEFVSTGTDANGEYLIFGLSPGDYRAVFRDLPADFVFSPTGQGSPDVDSDPDPGTGTTAEFFLDVGDDLADIDAGINLPSLPVATDDSGFYTPGVPRVVAVLDNDTTRDPIVPSTVRIVGLAGGPVLSLDVDGQGEWTVNTGDGTITFTPDPGYEDDPTPIQYTGQDAFANVSNPATVTLTTEPQPSRIDGVVWADGDENGARDPGEALLEGVLVSLLDEDGLLVATNRTDASGAYSFTNLFLTAAFVSFDPDSLPLPHSFTAQDSAPDTEDSDANPFTGSTELITLPEGERVANVDAGLVPPVRIAGRLWLDEDEDGIQDPLEPGLVGFEVQLFAVPEDNGPRRLASSNPLLVDITFTGFDGAYEFHAPPGRYFVVVVADAGYNFTEAGAGDDPDLDSDVDPAGLSPTVDLGATDVQLFDAGLLVSPGGISGVVWNDVNANGATADENLEALGIGGLPVTLFRVFQGVPVEPALATNLSSTASGSRGAYRFDGLAPGRYFVRVNAQNLPGGLIQNTTPEQYFVTVLAATVSPNRNFGFIGETTAIELASFAAAPSGTGVRVDWTTASESDNFGFRVYRSTRLNGARAPVGPELIEGQGTGSGATYSMVDADLAPGRYFYWLEDIDMDGTRTFHGPAVVTVAGASEVAASAEPVLPVVDARPVEGAPLQVIVAVDGRADFTADGGNVLVTGVEDGARALDRTTDPGIERRGETVTTETGTALYFSAPAGALIQVRPPAEAP